MWEKLYIALECCSTLPAASLTFSLIIVIYASDDSLNWGGGAICIDTAWYQYKVSLSEIFQIDDNILI